MKQDPKCCQKTVKPQMKENNVVKLLTIMTFHLRCLTLVIITLVIITLENIQEKIESMTAYLAFKNLLLINFLVFPI